MSRPWPDVTRLIPHRPPILMVEEIVGGDEEELACRGSLPAESSPFLALELAAQTAAVMAALRDDDGEARGQDSGLGYLAAIQDARFLTREIPTERSLLATVRRTRSMPPLTKYSITVTLEEGSVDLVVATLSTFRATSRR